ncbi:MAG: HD domain-containing protein [Patescibacteria group bacterium]|nr:HD domain-containing protein [Patescibacteria group bacterium]MDD4695448.1 HD domain-containing protein [Patescibacteria group bacterium]
MLNSKNIQLIKILHLENELENWKEIKELKSKINIDFFDNVNIKNKKEAISKSIFVIKSILKELDKQKIDILKMDPGHGIGHMTRDYINALRLAYKDNNTKPKELFIGIIGAALHDIGSSLIERYSESQRLVRHAEMGALLFKRISQKLKILNKEEEFLICYAIAAHTTYLKVYYFKKFKVEPYKYILNNKVVMSFQYPRFADRLDANGAFLVARDYLILNKSHMHDGSMGKFFKTNFKDDMKITLRAQDEIEKSGGYRTALEHLNIYMLGQKNSIHSQYDTNVMEYFRDNETKNLKNIINSILKPKKLESKKIDEIQKKWTIFLYKNIEPTEIGKKTAIGLSKKFKRLKENEINAWTYGFYITMQEYNKSAYEMLKFLDKIPKEYQTLPVIGKLKTLIKPSIKFDN